MPTKNPRLNVVLDDDLYKDLSKLAKKRDKTLSIVAKDLIEEALERQEDLALSRLAALREEKSENIIDHEAAWE